MKMSLGLNEKTAEAFLSPKKGGSDPLVVDEAENEYEEVEEVYV